MCENGNDEDDLITYEIEHISSLNERVQAIHYFLDGSFPIPPVDIKNVDIRCSQFLQAGFYTDMH